MSIKRFNGAGVYGSKTNKVWDQTTIQGGMFALATISLTSSQSSVTFTGIPDTYSNLQIRATTLHSFNNDSFYLRFNGDSASNYSWGQLYGDGAGVAFGSSGGSSTWGLWGTGGANTASYTSASIIEIADANSTTKNKTVRSFSGGDRNVNSSSYLKILNCNWRNNTDKINSITLYPENGTFSAYTHFALYGIRTA